MEKYKPNCTTVGLHAGDEDISDCICHVYLNGMCFQVLLEKLTVMDVCELYRVVQNGSRQVFVTYNCINIDRFSKFFH